MLPGVDYVSNQPCQNRVYTCSCPGFAVPCTGCGGLLDVAPMGLCSLGGVLSRLAYRRVRKPKHNESLMALTEQRLREIEGRLRPLLAAEERAAQLRPHVPDAEVFVGVSGIQYDEEPFEILPGFLAVRSVKNAPGVVHVCRAADPVHSDYLAVARFSHAIAAEITCGSRYSSEKIKPGIHLTQVTQTSCSWAHSVLASQSATIERYGVGSTAMACCTRR